MTAIESSSEPYRAALVDMLVTSRDLRSKEWITAFSDTPRHLFTPQILTTTLDGANQQLTAERYDEWLALAYSDTSLVTHNLPHGAGYLLPDGEPLRVPTSSSTMPSLMARMLEILDVQDGMRVLEIGTGTGYNAALLTHRLGSENVVSIDIDPTLVEHAGQRLTTLGHRPHLATGDGAAGVPDHGPYDRIIATAAVHEIPTAWIHQLAPGGKILCNLRGDLAGGTLCLLSKHDSSSEVIGRILPLGGCFMWMRPHLDDPHLPHEHDDGQQQHNTGSRTTTRLDPTVIPINAENFRFLLQLQLRGARGLDRGEAFDPLTRTQRDAISITAAGGSRAAAFTEPDVDGTYCVIQTGPRRLWDTVETTHRMFVELDRPEPDQFGIVANDSTQFVWLDDDDAWHRWPLPLV
jgi:protein-L-isoaspartate O-methyltransferase